MSKNKRNLLITNVMFWVVGALLHPVSQIVPTGSGDTPKIFSLLIPIMFMLLAFGSTSMLSRAIVESSGQ